MITLLDAATSSAATSSGQPLRRLDSLFPNVIGDHEEWYPNLLRRYLYRVYAEAGIGQQVDPGWIYAWKSNQHLVVQLRDDDRTCWSYERASGTWHLQSQRDLLRIDATSDGERRGLPWRGDVKPRDIVYQMVLAGADEKKVKHAEALWRSVKIGFPVFPLTKTFSIAPFKILLHGESRKSGLRFEGEQLIRRLVIMWLRRYR